MEPGTVRPDTVLSIAEIDANGLIVGDMFEFARYEIPEQIGFGGDQILAVQQLIGGVRVIDAMGPSEAPLEWSGLFQGESAMPRARYLDRLRKAGKPLLLGWDELRYKVMLASFRPDYQRFYQIPYRISFTVVEDLSSPVTAIVDAGIDDMIADDMNGANALGDLIGDGPLSELLSALDSAIRTVSSFATAAQSTINSVLQPLAAVQARVRILVSTVGNTVANVTTLGGILPNNPIAQQAAKLTAQASAMTQLPQLYNLQSVLGRMGGNLGAIGKGTNTVTQAGGNLYSMASKAYGDATAWTTLAKANKLSDPQLVGINTIAVPATPDGSGGVLNA